MISIYATFANLAEAKKICHFLVQEKLAACANIFPTQSIYPWEGKIKNQKEFAAIIKSNDFDAVAAAIKKRHSYKIPCIVELKINKTTKEYKAWLLKNLKLTRQI